MENKNIGRLLKIIIAVLVFQCAVLAAGLYFVGVKADQCMEQIDSIQEDVEGLVTEITEKLDTTNEELSEISELCGEINGIREDVEQGVEELKKKLPF